MEVTWIIAPGLAAQVNLEPFGSWDTTTSSLVLFHIANTLTGFFS